MTVHKGIEAVFEAIPSSVLQIIALLLASEKKVDAIVSILVSAATLGFTSAMTNYDWDTSPTNRGSNPIFYGELQHDKLQLLSSLTQPLRNQATSPTKLLRGRSASSR